MAGIEVIVGGQSVVNACKDCEARYRYSTFLIWQLTYQYIVSLVSDDCKETLGDNMPLPLESFIRVLYLRVRLLVLAHRDRSD